MYFYRYAQGQWSSIGDPLNGKTLDDADYREGYGKGKLVCHGLSLSLYSYDPSDISFSSNKPKAVKKNTIPYKFCCTINAARTTSYIWIPDLTDLIQLFQELQVVSGEANTISIPALQDIAGSIELVVEREFPLNIRVTPGNPRK